MTEKLRNFTCIAGVLGIVGTVVAVMAIVVAMFVYPWSDFLWDTNSISSLGAVGPPYLNDHIVLFPEILDYGWMAIGILFVIFSLGLLYGRKGIAKDTKTTMGCIIFLISSAGVFCVGLFPMPYDIPHGISSIVAFVGMQVAVFFFFRKFKILSMLSNLSGLISLIGIAWFVAIEFMPNIVYGLAAPSIVIIFPVFFWVISVSTIMIKGKLDIL